MREINLDRLRTLVAIADLGSFAEAARALHLAPPTVSLHITDLEARIGAPLLTRKRGQVRPTPIGETLLERARRLLAEADQALDDVQRQVQGLGGRVRLGASTGAIAHLLPQALETLGREHPGIDVQVAVLTSQETLQQLRDGVVLNDGPTLPARSTSAWWRCRSLRWRGWCCGHGGATPSWRSCPPAGMPPRASPRPGSAIGR